MKSMLVSLLKELSLVNLPNKLLRKVLFILLLATSSAAQALTMGDFVVNSFLDKELQAEIVIDGDSGDNLNTLEVSIASEAEFNQAGILRSPLLDQFDFEIVKLSDDKLKILVTTENNVAEPYIHMLLKIRWNGGQLLREFTALIDPPLFSSKPAEPVNTAKTKANKEAELKEELKEVETPKEPVTDAPAAVASEISGEFSQNSYGPVQAGETLSEIAKKIQKSNPDLSIYQIMQVLFEENPKAFINNNINGLIQGSVLNLGDINRIRAVDVSDAKSFFKAQASDWTNVRSVSGSDSLKVGQDQYNDSEDIFSESPAGAIKDSFQVGASTDTESLISDSDSEDSGAGEVVVLRQQISELESSLSSSSLENQELKERVSILEGQLADMNELMKLDVEDVDLASLEDTLAKNNAAAEKALDGGFEVVDDVVSGSLESLEEQAEAVVTDIADDTGLELAEVVDDVVAPESGFTDAEPSVVEDIEVVDISKAKPITVPVAEPSIFEKAKSLIIDGGFWKVLAGVGGVIAIALGALFVRRRRADEEFEISMLSIESNSQSINTVDSASISRSMSASVTASINESEMEGDDKETSFLTVYSDSDAVVQADEVDPIAEADVYIAYGRHEQAEEVLLDGVTNYPERTDIKHKLLTVYHKNNNSEGFERVAEELYSQRDTLDPEVWNEICNMGREIDEGNPLFELSPEDIVAAASASDAVVSGEKPEESESIDEAPASEERNSQFGVDDDSVHLINFDEGRSEISELDEVQIDSLDIHSDNAEEPEISVDESEESIEISDSVLEADDLEISMDDIDITIDDAEITIDEDDIEIDDTLLEINEADEDDIEINDSVIEIDDLNIEESIDSDAIEFELDSGDDAAVDSDLDELISENLIDDIELDLADDDDLDSDLGELTEVSDMEIDEDHDELRTQYELAKVFADLGDEDGARKILKDIIDDKSAADDLVVESKALLETIS